MKIANLKINKADFNIELESYCYNGLTFDNDSLKSLVNAKVGDIKKIFVEHQLSTLGRDEKKCGFLNFGKSEVFKNPHNAYQMPSFCFYFEESCFMLRPLHDFQRER